MNFDKKIIGIRKQNNLTQEELAEKLNVSRQTVSNWETSKCYPDIETLVIISDKFNITLDKLIKEDIKMIKEIDRKTKLNKKIKYAIIILIIILTISGIMLYNKNNKINNVMAQNNELKEDLEKFKAVDDNKMIYRFNIEDISIEDITLDYHNLNIYIDNKLSIENVKVLAYKDKKNSNSTSFDTLNYILAEVSHEDFNLLKEAEYYNKSINLKNN